MIKLICSDLDGTLLPYGQDSVGEETFALIQALGERGILFCPASGRQYESLRRQFAPVAERCAFLCENGAALYHRGRLLGRTAMPRAQAEAIAWDMWRNSDGLGEVMLCGQDRAYLMSRGRGMAERLAHIGFAYTFVDTPAEVPGEIVKVSLYVQEGIAPYASYFVPKWQAANAAVAGPKWIDTTLANKGTGLKMLWAALGITPEQTLAFGDNYNDVAMLDAAGTAYIMDSAAPELLARYPRHTADPRAVMRALLAGA